MDGGVSSDIWRAELAGRPVCIKQALAKLKVADDWRAPVERNAFEAAWLETANRIVPGAAPEVLFHDPEHGFFVMPFLDPASHPTWKYELRDGRCDADFAAATGRAMARIHSATAGDPEIARRFGTDTIFHEIRLAPYLIATAERHPDLRPRLLALAENTAANHLALVHGDMSPKNILVGPDGPIFLDAECAWYGDPAFDLAFCLNHLLLKCLWTPAARTGFLDCFDAMYAGYLDTISGLDNVEQRAADLLPGLMLARIDGKSPVEYITTDTDKDFVRCVATNLLKVPPASLADLRRAWESKLRGEREE